MVKPLKASTSKAHHRHFTRDKELELCTFFCSTSWILRWLSRLSTPLVSIGSRLRMSPCWPNFSWAARLTWSCSLCMWQRVALYYRIDVRTSQLMAQSLTISGRRRFRICFAEIWFTCLGTSWSHCRVSNLQIRLTWWRTSDKLSLHRLWLIHSCWFRGEKSAWHRVTIWGVEDSWEWLSMGKPVYQV